ncbi:MAG: hypothetical protein M3463_20450, partial [Verrucomicrobiota bacterium]|nr:hypothetical protein [Verrucomicrobiota bacterium]
MNHLPAIRIFVLSAACAATGWLAGYSMAPSRVSAQGPIRGFLRESIAPPARIGQASDAITEWRAVLAAPTEASDEQIAMQLLDRFDEIPSDSIPAALAELLVPADSTRRPHGAGVAKLLAGAWAERDWEVARNWFVRLSRPQQKEFSRAITETWVQKDPKGLLDWAEQQTDEGAKQVWSQIGDELMTAAARTDPMRGLQLVLGQRPDGEAAANLLPAEYREGYVGTLFGEWARLDLDRASRAISDLPAGGLRSAAARGMARSLATQDVERARAWGDQPAGCFPRHRGRPGSGARGRRETAGLGGGVAACATSGCDDVRPT